MNKENYPSPITERLQKAVRHLKKEHRIKNQVDLAAKMGLSPITVSRALNGTYKGEKFAQDLNAHFEFMFSISWLLYGEGDMLAAASEPPPLLTHPSIISTSTPASASTPSHTTTPAGTPDTIPAWADALIQLASDNAVAIQNLRSEVAELRAVLIKITQMYNLAPEALPMAAENHKSK